jgi:hypothetical protein
VVVKTRFSGRKEMAKRINTTSTAFKSQSKRAISAELSIELREVDARTPVDKGNLKESNRIDGPTFEGNTLRAYIRSGDENAPYALYVHEDLEAFHRVGQAKYLESVLMESAPYLMARFAKRLRLGENVGAFDVETGGGFF